jgi:ABC-type phosphate/phosphonate transport system substrate-binding protein
MIASLPMYDWPETQAANDLIWQQFADHLAASGVQAPLNLTRNADLESVWLSPDLLLAQTCSYPLETVLKDNVIYIATPTYAAEGCEKPGRYRSVILKAGAGKHVHVPAHDNAQLPDWLPDDRMAVNGLDSMSGYHALKRDAQLEGRRLPTLQITTGSHRASIIALAEGAADMCAVDCLSWAMAQKHEPAARQVHVTGWTKIRPGLPLITALGQSLQNVQALRHAAKKVFNAVVLDTPTER